MRRVGMLVAVVGLALASCAEADQQPASAPASVPSTTTTTSTTGRPVTTASTAVTTTSPPTTTRAAPTTRRCRTVAFTPNSEDAASDVTATGLACSEAESFVRVAGRHTSAGGPQEVDVEGYHCVRTRTEEDPLPRSFYECTNGSKKVTFVRS